MKDSQKTQREAYQRPEVKRLESMTDITPEGIVGTFPVYYVA